MSWNHRENAAGLLLGFAAAVVAGMLIWAAVKWLVS